MSDPTPDPKVATPPRMVCKNCGLSIFNRYPLGYHYLHTVTGKHECKVGKKKGRLSDV